MFVEHKNFYFILPKLVARTFSLLYIAIHCIFWKLGLKFIQILQLDNYMKWTLSLLTLLQIAGQLFNDFVWLYYSYNLYYGKVCDTWFFPLQSLAKFRGNFQASIVKGFILMITIKILLNVGKHIRQESSTSANLTGTLTSVQHNITIMDQKRNTLNDKLMNDN